MLGVTDIEQAAQRLEGVSVHTPLLQNFELNQAASGTVLVKPECLQVAGAFKIRGAYNRLSQLSEEEASHGVVAWSSGNHAQGVAAAGERVQCAEPPHHGLGVCEGGPVG